MRNTAEKLLHLTAMAAIVFSRCGVAPVQNAGGSSDTEISKTITGAVVDINGKAVPNAAVILSPDDTGAGAPPFGPGPGSVPQGSMEATTTDSNGVYRITDVHIGRYSIEINSGDSIATLVHCLFDSGDTVKKMPVDTLKPMVTITGTIVPDGSQTATVVIDGLVRHVQVDSFGRFQIKVPYGEHRIRFSSRDQGQRGNVSLPFMNPGTVQDIGYIDPSSTTPLPPSEDSAHDVSAMRLFLIDCGLDSVPVESVAVFRNGRLTEAHLRHRGLHALSIEIVRLPKLELIDAGCNELRAPFKVLSQCASLTVLRLDSNHLPFLPYDIASLRGIKELDLSNNEIPSLPISIVSLAPASLNLDFNCLMDISGPTAEWADRYDPNWRQTQRPAGGPPFRGFEGTQH
jgi:hypothetical protein